jgi:hypothetical protein
LLKGSAISRLTAETLEAVIQPADAADDALDGVIVTQEGLTHAGTLCDTTVLNFGTALPPLHTNRNSEFVLPSGTTAYETTKGALLGEDQVVATPGLVWSEVTASSGVPVLVHMSAAFVETQLALCMSPTKLAEATCASPEAVRLLDVWDCKPKTEINATAMDPTMIGRITTTTINSISVKPSSEPSTSSGPHRICRRPEVLLDAAGVALPGRWSLMSP